MSQVAFLSSFANEETNNVTEKMNPSALNQRENSSLIMCQRFEPEQEIAIHYEAVCPLAPKLPRRTTPKLTGIRKRASATATSKLQSMAVIHTSMSCNSPVPLIKKHEFKANYNTQERCAKDMHLLAKSLEQLATRGK
eukprot:c18279_g1_i1.p1 GENE.c18279_g1_i1~~c18279_g1_i1.p1  ORF type:complete len:138 (+),score=34.29 c18279_g1_i1:204-617(+)